MRQKNIQCYIEPFLHLLLAVIAIWHSVPHLFTGAYNNGFLPWYVVISEPNFYQESEECECEPGAAVDTNLVFVRQVICFRIFLSERRLLIA